MAKDAKKAKAKTPTKKQVAPPAKKTTAPVPKRVAGKAPPALAWEQQSKDTWWAPDPTDASLYGARIKMMSNTFRGKDAAPTYSVTRSDPDGCSRYLGSDPTLEAAKRRAQYREKSPSVLRDEVAGGLPAFLALAPEERKASWAKVPLPARPSFGFGQQAREQVEAGRSNVEKPPADPAAARAAVVRAALKAERKNGKARSSFPDDAVIEVLVKENPCKKGTGKHARFQVVMDCGGKTVAQYRAAQGNMETLENAVKAARAKVG